jgi:HEPN domain-containing protein
MGVVMARRKKSNQEIAEENQRTNSMGLFVAAEAFAVSARALEANPIKHGFRLSPIHVLYFHAIELYLKALLRQKYSVHDLENKFRHQIKRMTKEAKKLGLKISKEDQLRVFSIMTRTDTVIRSRYLRTGVMEIPPNGALNRACANLHANVGQLLRDAGLPIRM